MTDAVITISHDADTALLARLMISDHLRSVPVVDGGRLVGIATRRDMLRTLSRSDSDIAGVDIHHNLGTLGGTKRWHVQVSNGEAVLDDDFITASDRSVAQVLAAGRARRHPGHGDIPATHAASHLRHAPRPRGYSSTRTQPSGKRENAPCSASGHRLADMYKDPRCTYAHRRRVTTHHRCRRQVHRSRPVGVPAGSTSRRKSSAKLAAPSH